ncbi:MAG: RNA-directed DNA polymerase [Bacteroidales bacterium]|nr:RNA-directed DNA polymerase [Bacteroidales bacterium]
MNEEHQGTLLERIYSWENLLEAYHEAARDKWYRNDVTAFAARLEENLISIQNDLMWRTYTVGRYRQFYVTEPKKRLVMALGFRDRVVQWAIYRQINQELDNGMIYHSYGCRVEKGTTRAADRLQYWCTLVDRKPERWHYLKLDISKYFYRVDHEVLLGILRRKYPDEDGLLWLMETIINCDHTPFGLPPGKSADEVPPSERLFEVGMPIGNLTSQLLANVCLNELDQYIKHELKCHFYVRYMDDMVLLAEEAATPNEWRVLIEDYLNRILHLELNSKTTIGLVCRGITFVGCRIYPGYRKPTPNTVRKMKARMRYIAKEYEAGLIDFDAVDATMQSYFGMLGHCAAYGLKTWISENIIFKRGDGDPSGEVETWTQ